MNIDWKLLSEQKDDLVMVISKCEATGNTPVLLSSELESLRGILHLIDAVQDEAADRTDEQIYFPTED